MSMAVALLLAFALVPHHHHGEAVCWAVERCELDGAVNDEHTHHDASDSHSPVEHHDGDISDLTTPPDNDVVLSADYHYIMDFLSPYGEFNFSVTNQRCNDLTDSYLSFYLSSAAHSSAALRAPPCV